MEGGGGGGDGSGGDEGDCQALSKQATLNQKARSKYTSSPKLESKR